MPTKQRRYSLKAKEAKQILAETTKLMKLDLEALFGSKANVEVVESDVGLIYLINGKAMLFKAESRILPTLLFTDFTNKAPKIVVDMGAVPYVCKGADVMRPGVVRIEKEFSKGELVVVIDLKHSKALALGESSMDSVAARQAKKGPIVKTVHYVSDKIWDYIKTLELT
jgi:PUA-domain protein